MSATPRREREGQAPPSKGTEQGSNLIGFRWGVPHHGYWWASPRPRAGRYLLPKSPSGRMDVHVLPRDLYLEFANLTPTRAGILPFANRYGWLGTDDEPCDSPGERIDSWCRERSWIRVALQVWQAVERRELARLREWITVVDQKTVRDPETHKSRNENDLPRIWYDEVLRGGTYHLEGQRRVPGRGARGQTFWRGRRLYRLITTDRARPTGRPLGAEELLEAGRHLVDQLMSERLRWPHIAIRPPGQLPGMMRYPYGVCAPRTLLGVLWLKMVGVAAGERQIRRCMNTRCGRWFEIEPNGRKTRRYCRQACRQAVYRRPGTD